MANTHNISLGSCKATLDRNAPLEPLAGDNYSQTGSEGRSYEKQITKAPEPLTSYFIPMGIIWMLIIGLVVGAIAKLLMPGRDPGGFIVTILLGIAGALIAGFAGRALGWYAEGQPAGLIASVVGAILLLLIYRMIKGRTV